MSTYVNFCQQCPLVDGQVCYLPKQSLGLLFGLDDLGDLGKLDELVHGLEGNAGVIIDLVVVDHLVHVVGRDWSDDVLALLVVPHLGVLVQSALVELIEKREGSWLVVLLLLLADWEVLAVFGLADQQDLLGLGGVLLLAVGLGLDVEVVGIIQILGEIFGLLGVLSEEAFNLSEGREELEVLARDHLEASQQLRVPDRCHLSTLDYIAGIDHLNQPYVKKNNQLELRKKISQEREKKVDLLLSILILGKYDKAYGDKLVLLKFFYYFQKCGIQENLILSVCADTAQKRPASNAQNRLWERNNVRSAPVVPPARKCVAPSADRQEPLSCQPIIARSALLSMMTFAPCVAMCWALREIRSRGLEE